MINRIKKYKNILITIVGLVVIFALAVLLSGKAPVATPLATSKATYMYFDNFKTPTITIDYYYSGDRVIKQKTIISTAYESLGKTKAEVEKDYSGLAKRYQKLAGVESKTQFDQSVIVETINVNYDKTAEKELSALPGEIQKGELSKHKKVSLKKSEAILEKHGFVDMRTSNQSKEKETKNLKK